MSESLEGPGPSRSKRKSSDPDTGHEEIKFKADEKPEQALIKSSDALEEEVADDDSTAELGDYLSAQYEILLRVLNNLPAFDLRRAAQVSKSWQSAARVVQNARLQLHWLFWRAIVAGWNVPLPLALYSSICEHVHSQPVLCVAFFSKTAKKSYKCNSSEIICPVTKENKCCGFLHPIESYLSSALGPKCEIVSFTVSGIVGSSFDLQSTFEVEHTKAKTQSMSAALFPKIPGVSIFTFKLSNQELLCAVRQQNSGDVAKLLGLPDDRLVQAVILFSGYRIRSSEIAMLVSHIQARQEHRFALAGGIGENQDYLEGLIFLGENVCAASLVIQETVTEKDTFIEQVNKIKQCNLPTERTMCFMFTCLGRGMMWWMGDVAVESSLINTTFPGCPVIGFFGRGEIGLNFLPEHALQDSSLFWKNFQGTCQENKSSLQAPPKLVKRGSYQLIILTVLVSCICLLTQIFHISHFKI